jgi:ABC-type microcin C transport system permease subunit YejB
VQKYIAQRLILTIPTIIAVTVLTFLFLRVFLPADVIDFLMAASSTNTSTGRVSPGSGVGLLASSRETSANHYTVAGPSSAS